MRKILSLCVLLCVGSLGLAQEEKGHGKIHGSVVDAETNQPVEFANVALLDPATQKPVDGSVADMKGEFVINKVATGTYTVAVSFIGYETQTIEGIAVEDKRDDVDLYAEAMERLCVEARPPTETSKVLEDIRRDLES